MKTASQPARRQSLTGVRLRKHSDYGRAYEAGRKRQSASMSWFLAAQAPGSAAGSRVGLTVGKKLGKAHDRNRIKRRMREALRRNIELLPHGYDMIFHPRRTVLTMDYAILEAEVAHILRQANAVATRASAAPARTAK